MRKLKTSVPPENETDWFYVKNWEGVELGGLMATTDLKGWHLGWHSGTRWHSYLSNEIAEDDSAVMGWCPLGLPVIGKK